jgi:excisionase family DNA binding protein
MATTNQPTKTVMSRREAAEYIGIGKSTLDKLNIPKTQIRRRVLYQKETIDKWLLSQQTKGARA